MITEAGNHPKVARLAYIAAFAPDKGESVTTLNKASAPGASVSPILPPQDRYLFQDKTKFPASFAADVDAEKAAFWADSQVPWGVEAGSGTISVPAWRTKPSWYLITTDDRMIPLEAQRAMAKRAGATVVEVKGSHSVYASYPRAVAALIPLSIRIKTMSRCHALRRTALVCHLIASGIWAWRESCCRRSFFPVAVSPHSP